MIPQMNFCFFTEIYYKGGLDTFLITLFNTWSNPEDKITLVCNATHPGIETIEKKTRRSFKIIRYHSLFSSKLAQGQSNVKFFRYLPIRILFVFLFRILQYPILFPYYVVTLALYFRNSDFDRLMVVNGGYPASLSCRCALIAWRFSGKRPLAVMNFHNSVICSPWYYSFMENVIDKLVVQSAFKIISVSSNCLSSIYNRRAFVGCNKLTYIYNGIEDPVDSSCTIELTSKARSTRYCLMLGTYELRKGHSFLLRAYKSVAKTFPDVKLHIYGYGKPHEIDRVANEVKRLGLVDNVMLGEFQTNTSELLSNASVLVVPSQDYESFGLTIIEAMAFGVPVVSTNVGGIPEILSETMAGYVCSHDNELEFADAIKRILGNLFLASKLAENGRKTFESKFMASTMTKNYELILR